MYFTHHFSHQSTLSRAQYWLSRLGFGPDQVEALAGGIPRLAVSVKPSRLSEVRMLINAVESADPDGWPSFWETARLSPTHAEPMPEEAPPAQARNRHAVIGWHPVDSAPSARPNLP